MNTLLNPDALKAAARVIAEQQACGHCDGTCQACLEDASAVVTAYLTVALPEAKALAWEEGFQAGWEEHEDPGAFVNDFWDAKTPNPYLPEGN